VNPLEDENYTLNLQLRMAEDLIAMAFEKGTKDRYPL
jgi:hypothetical protein